MTPSFQYSDDKGNWPDAFVHLLFAHGPPPPGIKWYGEAKRLSITNGEAREWVRGVVKDIVSAMLQSGALDHTTPRYREMRSLHMKNLFLEWCREG